MDLMHADYELTEVECDKCNKIVSTVEKDHHDSRCTGVHVLQCPKCLQMFANKHQKAAHKKKYTNIDCSTNVINSNNTTNSNNNNINITNIIVQGEGVALQQVLDFASTQNAGIIITHLQGNPAEIQAAQKLGDTTLQQALTKISHFTGPLATRNITRFDRSNSITKVIADGRPVEDAISRVLDMTEKRNREIANDPSIKKLLTKDMNKVILPMPESNKEWRTQRSAMRQVIANKGAMNSRLKHMFPRDAPPPSIPLKILASMVVESMLTMPDDFVRMAEDNEYLEEALQSTFLLACNQFTHKGNEWWTIVPDGNGWMLCDKAPKLISDQLHNVQQHAIDQLLKMKTSVESGPEFDRLRDLSDCLCRFNIKPSVEDIMDILKTPLPSIEASTSTATDDLQIF